MTDFEVGWLAGIMDGEGSISLYYNKKRNTGSCYIPVIRVVNTDIQMIKTLQKLTLLGKIHKHTTQLNRKEAWIWAVTSTAQIITLLTLLIPHLITKKERAKVLLQFCVCKTKITKHVTILKFYYVKMKTLAK